MCQTSTVEDLYIDSHFPDISKIKQLYIESSPYSENSIFDHIICEALEMGWSVYEASRFRIGTTQSAQNDLQEALRSKIFLIDGNGPEVPPGASFLTGLGLSMNRVTILYYSGTQTTHAHGREPNERNLMLLYGCSELVRNFEQLKAAVQEKLRIAE